MAPPFDVGPRFSLFASRSRAWALSAALASAAWAAAACSGDESVAPDATGEDAGVDAAPARPDTFCFTRPALEFCEDFDERPVPGAFAAKVEAGGGVLTIDDVEPASAPSSLLASIAAAPAGTPEGAARLEQTFSSGIKYRVFAQMKEQGRSSGGADASVYVAGLGFVGHDYEVGIGTDGTGAWFAYERAAGGAVQRFPATLPLPAGKWVSVRLDVDVTVEGEGTMLVRFGTDSVVESVAIHPPFAAAQPILLLGAWGATAPHTGWGFRFDNVTYQVD